jgi:hypothetical protein
LEELIVAKVMERYIACVLAIYCFEIRATEVETSQLPISEMLRASFPKLKAPFFVIISKKANVVLHENSSSIRVSSSIFESDDLTLLDICKLSTRDILFFQSGIFNGCAFKYKNKNSCEFHCALYGVFSKEDMSADIQAVSKWLDQFFIYIPAKKNELVAKIPVFYGDTNEMELRLNDDHFVLLSERCNRNIVKVFRYRTALRAPVIADFQVGWAFYKTDVFQNWISKTIKSSTVIGKSGRFKAICDSFSYIIFGAPSDTNKEKELSEK